MCQPVAKQYPTRVLVVQANETLRIISRDQLSREGGPIRYATLSHAWGNHMPIQTTIETKPIFEKSIPEELLPLTFKDAVSTTRALDIPYLWIDSLCIVQDDPNDWQVEASEMENTFSGGTINIAASDALDSTGGCFDPNDDSARLVANDTSTSGQKVNIDTIGTASRDPRVFVYQHENESRSTMIRFQTSTPRRIQSQKHLSSRGWVLQEEVLSPRTVHCMKSEIYWQCKCSYKTQSGQTLAPSEVFLHPADFNIEYSRRKERMWYEWIEDYSTRTFTFPSDRTAAIAGITNSYQKMTGHSPLLGSWKESFTEGLLWIRLGSKRPVGVLGMPSWTWLSCNSPVVFDLWGRGLSKDKYTKEDHVVLCTYDLTWTGLANVSNVQSSVLIIKGPIKDLCFRIAPDNWSHPPYFELEGEELDSSSPRPWSCGGQFDDAGVTCDAFTTYTCLLIRSYSDLQAKFCRETFLILELVRSLPVDVTEQLPSYRRIGVGFSYSDSGRFSLAEVKKLRLC
ncbi:hypothetical protein NM208_g4059 [Fusarium decemcellulare]|uniref:Uncharacterized protein n=1 Tax=Fusarium decemcellulare TaxID=57161 RepID=A0ACC1SLY5_9HYPO|nr:hypothetical protein NM208_g4059 [Fusarium decemcellulare]